MPQRTYHPAQNHNRIKYIIGHRCASNNLHRVLDDVLYARRVHHRLRVLCAGALPLPPFLPVRGVLVRHRCGDRCRPPRQTTPRTLPNKLSAVRTSAAPLPALSLAIAAEIWRPPSCSPDKPLRPHPPNKT